MKKSERHVHRHLLCHPKGTKDLAEPWDCSAWAPKDLVEPWLATLGPDPSPLAQDAHVVTQ